MKEELKEYDRCLRCGRKLKNPESRKTGYGIVCTTKQLYKKKDIKKLF